MSNKYIIKNTTDLANPLLGTKIFKFSDEFFASAKRIINPATPIFKENVEFLIFFENTKIDFFFCSWSFWGVKSFKK